MSDIKSKMDMLNVCFKGIIQNFSFIETTLINLSKYISDQGYNDLAQFNLRSIKNPEYLDLEIEKKKKRIKNGIGELEFQKTIIQGSINELNQSLISLENIKRIK